VICTKAAAAAAVGALSLIRTDDARGARTNTVQRVENYYGDDNDENHDDEDDVDAAGKCHTSKKCSQRVLHLSSDAGYSSMPRLVSFSALNLLRS